MKTCNFRTHVGMVTADVGIPVFGHKAGSVHVQEIARAFLRSGASVNLFTANRGGSPPPDLKSIPVTMLPTVANDNTAPGAVAGPTLVDAFNQQLWAQLEGQSIARGLDLIYERYSLWSFAAMDYAKARGIPGILEVNAPLIDEQNACRTPINTALALSIADRAFASADALIAVSAEVVSYLETFPGSHGKVHLIPNGADPYRFRESPVPPAAREFTVGFVGSLKPWHGVNLLVDAFGMFQSRFPHSRLMIVGQGPEEERIKEQVFRKGLASAVDFTGAVAPNDVPRYLAEMDVGVAPYPDLPGFYFSPLKLFEYMAAGLGVVASNIGQIPLVVEHGVTGWLTPAGDTLGLADALCRLRSESVLRRRMGKAAREKICREHNWDLIVARILGLAKS